MARPLLLVGAGGFGRETVEAVHAVNAVSASWDLVGFLDDRPELTGTSVDGTAVVGPVEALADLPDAQVVVCTGSPRNFSSRRTIVARLGLPDERYATVVHPTASVARTAAIGVGSVLLAGSVVTAAASIGPHVAMMPGVVITHDDEVGAFCTFAAGSRLGGGVVVEDGVYLGAGSSVREGCRVGAGAMLAMGAVAVTDVPAGEVWAGVPARFLRPVRPHPGAGARGGVRSRAVS